MWEKELNIAGQAARESGKILNDLFGKVTNIEKKGEIDLVTEADFQSEKAVMEIINSNLPKDNILTEETGEQGKNSERLWILDPLDGTTNFTHSFPFFAVSIALQVDKEVVLGVVYNPCTEEYFEARKGEGAFLNKKPIRVSQTKDLRESLMATGFPYSVIKDPNRVMGLLKTMIVHVQGVRRPGAASIDLCYVASGRLDGFWEEGLQPWDTAAGSLIVREAGGILTDYNGKEYSPFQKSTIAANPSIHQKMLDIIRAEAVKY
ncbi:inositol monophosphatase [Deltaproteobacteria bacterium]|nr:inositol monophosphatase [Deltaproteobacteria bacterium]